MKIDILESFDHYLTLPRDQAYNEFVDSKNLKVLRVMLIIQALITLIIFIVNLAVHEEFNFALAVTIVNFAAIVIIRMLYSRIFSLSNIRKGVLIFILSQLLFMITIDLTFPPDPDDKENLQRSENVQKDKTDSAEKNRPDSLKEDGKKEKTKDELTVNVSTGDDSPGQYLFFLAILLMIFKLPRQLMFQIFGTGVGLMLVLIIISKSPIEWGELLPNAITGIILFFVALSAEKSRQRKFTEHYDFHLNKNLENLRMKRELNYAREIQLSMLPKNEAVINGVRIAGVSIPASEVGGDYFDYFGISDHETGVFICDVSGHGVASALMLSALRSSMHLILDDTKNPKIVIEKLNRMIRKTQSRKMFVTAVLAIIDTSENKCRLYNAGHLPPYRISGETGEIFRIKKHGIALGAMGTVDSKEADNLVTFDFKHNDKIILYTDGVNEAMNEIKAEYGLDNLEAFLNANSERSAKELLDGIVNDVKRFSGSSIQRDDLTMLILERI